MILACSKTMSVLDLHLDNVLYTKVAFYVSAITNPVARPDLFYRKAS